MRALLAGRRDVGATLGGAFVAYYFAEVPSVFEERPGGVAADLAETMLGRRSPAAWPADPGDGTPNPPAAEAQTRPRGW